MPRWRILLVVAVFAVLGIALGARVVGLQFQSWEWLRQAADRQIQGTRVLPTSRGTIYDRNGEVLAVSTQVFALAANPMKLIGSASPEAMDQLSAALEMSPQVLRQKLQRYVGDRRKHLEIRLANAVPPERARAIQARIDSCQLKGLRLIRASERYYPMGEAAAHPVGFADYRELGRRGLEHAFNEHLQSEDGLVRTHRVPVPTPPGCEYRTKAVVESKIIQSPRPGQSLYASLDSRLQAVVHEVLGRHVRLNHAVSGSAVVIRPHTGEILALSSYPSYNPNDIRALQTNLAVQTVIEPGSTLKPFTYAAALSTGVLSFDEMIDTGNGRIVRAGRVFEDKTVRGKLTPTEALARSSQVAAVEIGTRVKVEDYVGLLRRIGFGQPVDIGFSGQPVRGRVPAPQRMTPIDQVALSYGYGISTSPLQLARAYGVLANGGFLVPLDMERREQPRVREQVMDPAIAGQVLQMLEQVVQAPYGTGVLARVPGYRVAGKTGTVRMVGPDGYLEDRYNALFVGILPVENPELVIVTVLNDLGPDRYYGSQVAAPLFAEVARSAVHIFDIPASVPSEMQMVLGALVPGQPRP